MYVTVLIISIFSCDHLLISLLMSSVLRHYLTRPPLSHHSFTSVFYVCCGDFRTDTFPSFCPVIDFHLLGDYLFVIYKTVTSFPFLSTVLFSLNIPYSSFDSTFTTKRTFITYPSTSTNSKPVLEIPFVFRFWSLYVLIIPNNSRVYWTVLESDGSST